MHPIIHYLNVQSVCSKLLNARHTILSAFSWFTIPPVFERLFLWFFSGKIRHETEITEHAQICKYVNLLGLPENRLLEAIKKNCKEKCARNISSLKKSATTDRSEADRAHFLYLHLFHCHFLLFIEAQRPCQFYKQQWTAAFRLISIFWSISSNILCIWLNFLSC